jgi:hypothetical protein
MLPSIGSLTLSTPSGRFAVKFWLRITMKLILFFFAAAAATSTVLAWDDEGHMMVAEIAWNQLSPASRARVSELLKLNPDYDTWIAKVPKSKRDQIAFVKAATWPDAIRSNLAYKNDGGRSVCRSRFATKHRLR